MQVYGNIASPIEKRTSRAGKEFYTFRLAENWGKRDDPNRTTMWYDVSAFISELDADMLAKGQYIKVTGRLSIQTFTKRNGEFGAAAVLLTSNIEPVERKRTEGADHDDSSTQNHSNEQAAPRPAREAQSAPQPRAAAAAGHSGFDDLDDDIPF